MRVGQAGPAAGERHEEGVARHLRQMQIQQHEVHVGLVQEVVGQMRITGGHDLATHRAEGPVQGPPDRGLVIDDEDARAHDAAARRSG